MGYMHGGAVVVTLCCTTQGHVRGRVWIWQATPLCYFFEWDACASIMLSQCLSSDPSLWLLVLANFQGTLKWCRWVIPETFIPLPQKLFWFELPHLWKFQFRLILSFKFWLFLTPTPSLRIAIYPPRGRYRHFPEPHNLLGEEGLILLLPIYTPR